MNLLQLNTKKTQVMFFKSQQSKSEFEELIINGNSIKPIEVAKTLGVEVDHKLSMKNMVYSSKM